MSLILDALRKSENDRERRMLPGIVERPTSGVSPSRLPLVLGALGALLLVNVIILGIVLYRSSSAPPAPPAPVATPATAPDVRRAPAPTVRAPALPPATRPLDAEAADADAEPEDAGGAPLPRAPPPVPTAGARRPIVSAARAAPERPVERAPALNDLPAPVASGLPHVSIDLHVYADDPAQRFVVINGERLREGGTMRDGTYLERITPDGVVLSSRGTRFSVPR